MSNLKWVVGLVVAVSMAAVARPRPRLAVSILAADQMALGAQVDQAERGGAEAVHVDVMDGHFVPNLAYGPDTVRALRQHTRLFIDVHLMVEDPDAILPAFAEAGADNITVHLEAWPHLQQTLDRIHALRPGLSAGVALNPETPVEAVEAVLPSVDRVMLMSVHAGFGGQHFLPASVARLRRLKALLVRDGSPALVEMDGGLDASNVGELVANGLDVAVAGSAVFHAPDVAAAAHAMVQVLRGLPPEVSN